MSAEVTHIEALDKNISLFAKNQIIALCEKADIPFSPIAQPEDLFDDPQLNAGRSLLKTILPDGTKTKLPNFPLEYGDNTEGVSFDDTIHHVPQIGEHTVDILR
jgi:crotonobetainyl-CoA:carnitine CoA-transferase CaiB-like acyl-CoA transferase